MKIARLLVSVAAWGAVTAGASAAPWSVIWFPANDTFRSWDWKEISGGNDTTMIEAADPAHPFPPEIHSWELAVCFRSDPGRQVRIPLPSPRQGNTLQFSSLSPDELRGEKKARLESLGEGTFLCAFLGDGRRISNVNRLTIRADYDPAREPFLRLVPIEAIGSGHRVTHVGAQIVPSASGPAWSSLVWFRPALEIDGVWSAPRFLNIGAKIQPLRPGVSYAWIYPLEGSGFEPPLHAFVRAQARLRLTDAGGKSCISQPFVLAVDPSEAAAFDHAFSIHP
jgi:hypothetical protein